MAQRKYQHEEESSKSNILTGLFSTRESVEGAFLAAIKCGFKPEDINIVMLEKTCKTWFDADFNKLQKGAKEVEGLTKDNTKGLVKVLANAKTLNSGLIISGPISSFLTDADKDTGNLANKFVNFGISEMLAKQIEKEISQGGALLGVKRGERSTELCNSWKTFNPKELA